MMQKLITLATTVHCVYSLCKSPQGVAAIGSGRHSIGNLRPVGPVVGRAKALSTAAALLSTAKLVTSSSIKQSSPQTCASSFNKMSSTTDDIPQSVQDTVNAVLQMYRSRDVQEQGKVLEQHYQASAHFVDPLMNCKGTTEILLAFYSLIKIFDSVTIEQTRASFTLQPRLPHELVSKDVKQVVVDNRQTYTFARTSRLSKYLLPEKVDIASKIYLTLDSQDGRILWHEDTWPGRSSMPSFFKRPVGVASFGMFRALGWGKEAPKVA